MLELLPFKINTHTYLSTKDFDAPLYIFFFQKCLYALMHPHIHKAQTPAGTCIVFSSEAEIATMVLTWLLNMHLWNVSLCKSTMLYQAWKSVV